VRVLAACTALAAASLLVLHEATYDPTAWLIWGRQIADGTLDTVAGPTWKPLPVLFTTPFSLAGDSGAMVLWLLIARIGGLLSLVLAYRVAARLGGRVAGAVAVLALLLSAEYTMHWLRGNSEGLLVMCALLAFDRHLAGRHDQAFAAAAAAALIRPDVWPLFGLYGLWLAHGRGTPRAWAVVLGTGAGVIVAWLLPEYLGSGDFFRGVTRAQEIVPGSPGASGRPFFEVFTNASQALSYGVYAGGFASLAVARRDRRVAALILGATVLMCVTAAMSAGVGFTGSLRYVALPAALVCVLAGIGWAWIARAVRPRWVVAILVAAAIPGLVSPVDRLGEDLDHTWETDQRLRALPAFIERAGGREAVLACGRVHTGLFSTQLLAYHLHVRQREIGIRPEPPGSILDATGSRLEGTPGFMRKLRDRQWTLQSTC
jgi:hypothetical protein